MGIPFEVFYADLFPFLTGKFEASALADQARGVLIDDDDNGVQRLMITPGKQLDSRTVFDVETLQSDDFVSENT